jgi:hypothetical protein
MRENTQTKNKHRTTGYIYENHHYGALLKLILLRMTISIIISEKNV